MNERQVGDDELTDEPTPMTDEVRWRARRRESRTVWSREGLQGPNRFAAVRRSAVERG